MKKIYFSLLVLSGFITSKAQDLAIKIPKDAMAVASVRGEHFLELMSVGEFNHSAFGKKLIYEVSEHKEEGKFTSIEDFGIRLNGTMYYYNQQTDSISYNCLLIPISDVTKFEGLFDKSQTAKIQRKGDTRSLYDAGENAFFQWNKDFAYVVSGNLHSGFIEKDSVMSERYGIKTVSSYDYNYRSDAVEDAEEISISNDSAKEDSDIGVVQIAPPAEESPSYDGANDIAISTPPVVEAYATPSNDDIVDSVAVATEDYPPMLEDAAAPVMIEAAPQEEVPYDYNNNAYQKAYETQREIKKELTRKWVDGFAVAGFTQNNIANSILSNQAYTQTLEKDAAATFYLSSMQHAFSSVLPYYLGSWMHLNNYMDGYGSINGKLYLNKKEMRLTSDMEVDDAKAASYKKIYNHKLNKKFANYINTDKVIGLMSSSINVEAYLKEMPQLLNNSYGKVFGMYGEEIGIGAELFSLLLDEKAVAKVIKGDALLLLTDVGPREYNYTSYEYNEDNYERTEVTRKKTETMPDFLFMMSSDDTHLIQRLLNYGITKKEVELKNGIYNISGKLSRKSPFGFHILIKDGIIFCGTSLKDLELISLDKFQGNISKEQKKLLLANNFSLFFNPKNLVGKISEKEFGSSKKLKDFNDFLGMTGSVYARSLGLKNNRISGEMVAEVPDGNENSLKYFFSLIDNVSKMDKDNSDDTQD